MLGVLIVVLPCATDSEVEVESEQRGGQGEPLHRVAGMTFCRHGHHRPVGIERGGARLQAQFQRQAAAADQGPDGGGVDPRQQARPGVAGAVGQV
ncbi:hypothetical protein D3C80_1892430 [compost metagenome]